MTLKIKPREVTINLRGPETSPESDRQWRGFLEKQGHSAMYCDPRWVNAICRSLRQKPYFIEARAHEEVVGLLPLIFIESPLFGRFLVSLPYVDWAGVIADDPQIANALIDRAVELADELDVRYLELRHQFEFDHELLTNKLTTKVQMRLPLSASQDDVWKGLKSVVRTQVRKATKKGLVLEWGGLELLSAFYDVFSRNMRDLGTPAYPRCLFHNILSDLPEQAELCIARLEGRPIAGCLAIHSQGLTEVPSASSLRAYRGAAANSLIYWRAIERAIDRGQRIFDFGRSTVGGPTYTFKKKWGAQPAPVVWQYYTRKGRAQAMRPDNPKFQLAIGIWKRLPVSLTRVLGPMIVRGIP